MFYMLCILYSSMYFLAFSSTSHLLCMQHYLLCTYCLLAKCNPSTSVISTHLPVLVEFGRVGNYPPLGEMQPFCDSCSASGSAWTVMILLLLWHTFLYRRKVVTSKAVYFPALPVSNYTAWWQRHMVVSSLQ